MSTEISYDIFWEWATAKYGEENCIQRGEEICINSPFVPEHTPDRGQHLYCNPAKGVYHCWKSDESGTLHNLVMLKEGCDFIEAQEILGGDRALYKLNDKITEFFKNKKEQKEANKVIFKKDILELPLGTVKITNLKPDDRLRIIAEDYLKSRSLSVGNLCICGSGKYAMRIIIPYYGPNNQLIYFNSRDITGKSKLRYKGPPKEIGVGKGDVVWMDKWPEEESTIHLAEGEFDAMALCQVGFNGAAAGGKNFSNSQLQLLKPYNITICFDLDKSGTEALNKIGAFMRSKQFVRGNNSIGYVKPAQGYKDWNDMLIKLGANILQSYIKDREKPLQWEDLAKLKLNSI
jgi:DNA primase